jgi:hypothetical protein
MSELGSKEKKGTKQSPSLKARALRLLSLREYSRKGMAAKLAESEQRWVRLAKTNAEEDLSADQNSLPVKSTAIEIEEFIKSVGSLTLVVGQKKDLLHDKQFLQEEVIGKLDNMLEYMEKFSKDIITLLESNQSLRNVVGILSSSLYVLPDFLSSYLSIIGISNGIILLTNSINFG